MVGISRRASKERDSLIDPFLFAVDQACSSGAELLAGLLIDILVLPGWGVLPGHLLLLSGNSSPVPSL